MCRLIAPCAGPARPFSLFAIICVASSRPRNLIAVLMGLGAALPSAAQEQSNPLANVSTTVQLPSLGVEVDANGLLSMSITDVSGKIRNERIAVAKKQIPQDIQRFSANRKISLRRLNDAIAASLNEGRELSGEIQHLAGLRRLDAVFLFPDDGDIVICGPAGGWFEEPSGRVVGIDDRQPIVLLDHFLTALRAFGPTDELNKVVLCSIDPTREGLERFKKLKKDMPIRFSDREWAELPAKFSAAMRESLGRSNIRVHGVPHSSHLAQIMIESDYRMKMIGVGLEPAPIPMTTFIDAIDRPISGFQQWWLRPNYQRLIEDGEKESLKVIGQTIELVTNRLELTADERLVASKQKSSAAANKYANQFTQKYAQIADHCPVFAQLRSISDLLVVAAWLKKSEGWRRIGWDGGLLMDREQFPEEELPVPLTAESVANAVTKGPMLVTPVGGGFSITPAIALDQEHLKVEAESKEWQQRRKAISDQRPADRWWWD